MRRILFAQLGARPGCADMHVTRLSPGRSTAPHTHDFHEAFLVLDGRGEHHFNRREIPLAPGHLGAVRPTDAHWFSTAPGESIVFVNVAVSAAWQRAFQTLLGDGGAGESGRSVALDETATQRLGDVLCDKAVTSDPMAALRAWQRVGEHLVPPAGPRAETPPAWLRALRQKIEQTPDALGNPIAYWQRLGGRSPEHLARSCRRFYGVTFSELLNQVRVERARHLLRTTDEKVITVALDSGFENMANFHRVFARLTGQTPTQWRRGVSAAVPIQGANRGLSRRSVDLREFG